METPAEEEKEICLVSISFSGEPVVPFEQYSTFNRLQRTVAWILQFVKK